MIIQFNNMDSVNSVVSLWNFIPNNREDQEVQKACPEKHPQR